MNNIEIKIYLYGSWQIQSWNQTGILLYYRNKEKFSEYNLRDECVNEISDSVFIYKNLYQTILKTDIVRGIPLFYGFKINECFITDNLGIFQKENGPFEIDTGKLEEYIASGFVYGDRTIYKNVYGLQAGEIVTIQNNKINSTRYFEYKPKEKLFLFESIAKFTCAFDQVLHSVFAKMIKQTPDVKRWVVPLSGGHDSRIIVNYLHKLGVKNLICFSYGTSKNQQSEISKQVAKALNYEWHFVEYTEEKWQQLHETGLIDDYIHYSFNGVSIPHLQDFLAVYELKEMELIKPGDIFVPGHALDFLAGSHLIDFDLICKSSRQAIKRVMNKFIPRFYNRDIEKTIIDIFSSNIQEPAHFQEYFNWQERQAKFIVNSIRVYEFFGFETRLPFWDKEIVDFWLSTPNDKRIGRKIFFEAEQNGILGENLKIIPFAKAKSMSLRNKIIKQLKSALPNSLKLKILRITKHKIKLNEGLNQIFALKAKSLEELLHPVEDFPVQILPYFHDYLKRSPYQLNQNLLTSLYTIRKLLDNFKNHHK